MRRMHKMALVVLVLLGAAALLFAGATKEAAGPAEEGKITIAYTGFPGGASPFWAEMAQYMKEEAEALGVEYMDLSPTVADAAAQKDSVDNAINRGVDGIIIGAVDNRAFGESLRRAEEKGIVCVAVDTAIDDPHITALAQTDNLSSARILGQYIVDNTPKGKILILGGTLGHQTGDARRDGVKQVLEANGYEVIFRACDWDQAKALETATFELAANPDVAAVFAAWDPGALSALSAVKQRGLLGKVKVYGFDGLPANLKSIKDGEQTATIKQDNKQMAQVVMRSVVSQIRGEAGVKKLLIDGFVIDASNVDQYLK